MFCNIYFSRDFIMFDNGIWVQYFWFLPCLSQGDQCTMCALYRIFSKDLVKTYSVVGLVCPRSEEQISEPIAV